MFFFSQDIEWPSDDEELSPEAVSAVETLLTMDPQKRPSAKDVQLMPFFDSIDWETLESTDPPFVPAPVDATDTRYFECNLMFYLFKKFLIVFFFSVFSARNIQQHLMLSSFDVDIC